MTALFQARFRRRPRDPDEGWEVELDGEWRDCREAGTPDGATDRRLRRAQEDPSLREALERSYPDGLLLSLRHDLSKIDARLLP